MVASSSPPPPSSSQAEAESTAPSGAIHAGSHIQRLFLSLLRVVQIQSRMMLLEAKATVQRIVLYAALFAVAGVLGLLAVIFLYIGVFQVLVRYVLAPPWVWLIYGGFHLLLAAGIAWWATRMLKKPVVEPEEPEEKEEAEYPSREREAEETPLPEETVP